MAPYGLTDHFNDSNVRMFKNNLPESLTEGVVLAGDGLVEEVVAVKLNVFFLVFLQLFKI